MPASRPGPRTLIAFGFAVLIGGSNFVAVRLSNRELDPFFGAGIRFSGAALVLFAILAFSKAGLPRGRQLSAAFAFGFLNFFASYALFYWGLQRVPAALAGVTFGAVPLFTFILAVVWRLERFQWRALAGAAIVIVGVAVMVRGPRETSVPFVYLLAVIGSALAASQSTVVLKRFGDVHPVALNAVAMTTGAACLLALSAASGEQWSVPARTSTWLGLAFLVPVGSVGLFLLFVYVVQHWTASGASYQFVLLPIVTAIGAAIVLDEPLNASLAIGGVLVILGTYVGALAPVDETPDPSTDPATTPAPFA